MAQYQALLLISTVFLLFTIPSSASPKNSSNPKTIVFQTTKDSSSKLHLTTITQKTPHSTIKLVFHLGAQTSWLNCQHNFYNSSSLTLEHCHSNKCKLAQSSGCFDSCKWPFSKCVRDACYTWPINPSTGAGSNIAAVSVDTFVFHSKHPTSQVVTLPNFIFTCVTSFIADGLPGGALGVAGFGNASITLPFQLAHAFNFAKKIVVCLSSSTKSRGAIILGHVPYNSNIFNNSLIFTPLVVKNNPFNVSDELAKSEYYIHVENIKVNGLVLKIDKEILSVTNNGQGVTKISTSRVYTTMESSIYQAVSHAFVKAVGNIVGRVNPVEPFGVCFNTSGVQGGNRVFPPMDLVMKNKAMWRIKGDNLMVQMKKDIWCLGFLENVVAPVIPPIEIGTHQIEENLMQFDLDKSMLGFTSLHGQGVSSCASLTSNLM